VAAHWLDVSADSLSVNREAGDRKRGRVLFKGGGSAASSNGSSSTTVQPRNAVSMSERLAPGGSGPLRAGAQVRISMLGQRCVHDGVRLGRVKRLEPTQIVLEQRTVRRL
jgi:hypothetical protein